MLPDVAIAGFAEEPRTTSVERTTDAASVLRWHTSGDSIRGTHQRVHSQCIVGYKLVERGCFDTRANRPQLSARIVLSPTLCAHT